MLHIDKFKVNCVIFHIHTRDANFNLIPNTEHLGGAFADQRHMLLVKMIIVVRKRTQTRQTLHCIVQLNEHPKAGYTADDPLEFLTDLVQHVFSLFHLLCITLCIHSHTLTLGRLLRNIRHTCSQIFLTLGC
ncbi:hypothetical protein D3C74_317240 [compost metagenome]